MRLRSDGRRHLTTAVDAPSMIPMRTDNYRVPRDTAINWECN
jgi:hypothetical protein